MGSQTGINVRVFPALLQDRREVLEPHRVGGERSARQSRPLDRAFALLDLLLARPAICVPLEINGQ